MLPTISLKVLIYIKSIDFFFRVKVNGSMCVAVWIYNKKIYIFYCLGLSKDCERKNMRKKHDLNYVHEATENVTYSAKFRLSEGEFIRNRLM